MTLESHWWSLDLTQSPASLTGWKFDADACSAYDRIDAANETPSLLRQLIVNSNYFQQIPRNETLVQSGRHDGAWRELEQRIDSLGARFRWGLGVAHPLGISTITLDSLLREVQHCWKPKLARQGGTLTLAGTEPVPIAAPFAAALGGWLSNPRLRNKQRWLVATTGLTRRRQKVPMLEWLSITLDTTAGQLSLIPEWYCTTSELLEDCQRTLSERVAADSGPPWTKILLAGPIVRQQWQMWETLPGFAGDQLNAQDRFDQDLMDAGNTVESLRRAWSQVVATPAEFQADCVAIGAAAFAAWVNHQELPRWLPELELVKRLELPIGVIGADAGTEHPEVPGGTTLPTLFWREIPEVWSSARGFDVPLNLSGESRVIVARGFSSNPGDGPRWGLLDERNSADFVLDGIHTVSVNSSELNTQARISTRGKFSERSLADWSLSPYEFKAENVARGKSE